MSINEIIIYIMVIFAALGALDRIFGSRFGLGEKFEEGIMQSERCQSPWWESLPWLR